MFSGVYWYMASWSSYYYCKMCDRPLSSQDYGTQGNFTSSGNIKTVYCRFSASTAEGPGKSSIIRGLVLITIGTPLIYLLVGTNPLFSGKPAPVITTLLVLFIWYRISGANPPTAQSTTVGSWSTALTPKNGLVHPSLKNLLLLDAQGRIKGSPLL